MGRMFWRAFQCTVTAEHRAPEFDQFLGEAGRGILHAGSYSRVATTPSLAEARAGSALATKT